MPSQTASLQSAGVCCPAGACVPSATFEVPQTLLLHVAVTQIGGFGHCVGFVHCTHALLPSQ